MIKKNVFIAVALLLVGGFIMGCGSAVPSAVSPWSAQTSPISQQLNEIFFYNSSTGWIAANNGLVLKTTNEGTTWTSHEVDSFTENQRTVCFLSTQEGFVAGGHGYIYRSADGGNTWGNQIAGASSDLFFDMVLLGTTSGCAVSNSNAIHYYNGSSWLVSGATVSETLYGLCYSSGSGKYYAVGANGEIMVSAAGADTSSWTTQTSPTTDNLKAVAFTDANNGWIVGDSGLILNTTNEGTTWTSVESGVTVNLRGIAFATSLEGWIVGNSGTILYTSNGGTNWNSQLSGTTQDLIDVYAQSGPKAWIVGANGTILKYE